MVFSKFEVTTLREAYFGSYAMVDLHFYYIPSKENICISFLPLISMILLLFCTRETIQSSIVGQKATHVTAHKMSWTKSHNDTRPQHKTSLHKTSWSMFWPVTSSQWSLFFIAAKVAYELLI